MRIADYLNPELVVIGLDTTGVEDTITALVDRVAAAGLVPDAAAVRKAVLERESSHTTALGNGVAVPHATATSVTEPLIVVGTAPGGVEFGPGGEAEESDRLFFLLLSPLDAAGTHIKLLARIVRLVRSDAFVDALVSAGTGEALVEAIEREDALHV